MGLLNYYLRTTQNCLFCFVGILYNRRIAFLCITDFVFDIKTKLRETENERLCERRSEWNYLPRGKEN